MDSAGIDKIIEKARIVATKISWNKVLVFSFCLLLAAIFWFIQIYNQVFNTTLVIPVKYVAVPDSVVFESNLPKELNITIKDNGYSLFKYFFTKRHDTLTINVTDILQYSSSKIIQNTSLENIIKEKLLPTSEILSYSPNRISFYHTRLEHKKIPVIFDGQIFLASDYLLNGDIEVTPDSVTVYGSQETLNNLDYAYTINDTINDFKSHEALIYSIKDIKNIKFVPDKVKVQVPVDKYIQKDVAVPITCINLPNNLDIKFFPSTVKISFGVGMSKYQSISEKDFQVQFDYNDLKDLKETLVPLRISSSPDYVQNIVMSPTEVEFIFEQK